MKPVVVLVVLFAIFELSAAQGRGLRHIEEKCLLKQNLQKSYIKSVINKQAKYFPEDDEIFNKYLGCYWRTAGLLDINDVIDYKKFSQLIQKFPKENFGGKNGKVGYKLANEAVESCKNSKGEIPGETIVMLQNCVSKYIANNLNNKQ